jgi:hypothetical protein
VAATTAAAALASEEDAVTPVFSGMRTVMAADDGHCILEGIFPRENECGFFPTFLLLLLEEEEETMTTMER